MRTFKYVCDLCGRSEGEVNDIVHGVADICGDCLVGMWLALPVVARTKLLRYQSAPAEPEPDVDKEG